MKKIIKNDKKLRFILKGSEILNFVSKKVVKNLNFSKLIFHNAKVKEKNFKKESSISKITYKCNRTFNKKQFNKFTYYSRHFFLHNIRNGKISEWQKHGW